MKIGILTFHRAHNYGAVLQCYALQEVLKGMGHEVEVIDYRPSYIEKNTIPYSFNNFLSLNVKHKILYFLTEPFMVNRRLKKYRKFEEFSNRYLCLSNTVYVEQNIGTYDVIVCGSDQIWNKRITQGYDRFYWGCICPNITKISYAASMESVILSSSDLNNVGHFLDNFKHIAVRECNLKNLLQPLTYKKINVVCDPTFLLKDSYWHNMAGDKPLIKGNYIVVYQTRHHPTVNSIAEKIRGNLKSEKIIYLSAHLSFFANHNELQCISPDQFLNILKFSQFVITTSFHGTAFSIIFKKDFYTIRLNDNNDSRSFSLLKTVSLGCRFISEYIGSSHIDYSSINEHIANMVDNSYKYISQSLK